MRVRSDGTGHRNDCLRQQTRGGGTVTEQVATSSIRELARRRLSTIHEMEHSMEQARNASGPASVFHCSTPFRGGTWNSASRCRPERLASSSAPCGGGKTRGAICPPVPRVNGDKKGAAVFPCRTKRRKVECSCQLSPRGELGRGKKRM